MLPSPTSKIDLEGRVFYVKRDDLLYPHLAGNKFRKFYSLLHTSNSDYNKIISYGGTQSNAMLAIAFLCKTKKWLFEYYTKPLPKKMKEQRLGNFYESKKLGMKHIEIDTLMYKDYIAGLGVSTEKKTFLLDQGGANKLAQEGIELLAQEIIAEPLGIKSIAIPSGTGTTALYLALALPEYKVYTIACIGNTDYLKEQMQALHKIPDNLEFL